MLFNILINASTRRQYDQWVTQSEVVQHLLSNLPSGIDADRVKFANAPFETPKNEPWVEIDFNDLGATRQDASNHYSIINGICNIDVYMPEKTGDKTPKQIAQSIKNLFDNRWMNELRFDVANVRPSPVGNWYRLIVEIPYTIEAN